MCKRKSKSKNSKEKRDKEKQLPDKSSCLNSIKKKENYSDFPIDVSSLPTEASIEKRKRRLPSYCQIVLMPMFAAMNKINDHLYLTGIGGMTQENFIRFKIDCIINATYEAPNLNKKGVESIRVPINDSPNDNIQEYFDVIADKINEKISIEKCNVVVHCVAGVSRSTSLIIAYLMKYNKMDLRKAFNYVHARRPVVRPNNGFFKQLIDFEYKLFGRNSCKMIRLKVNDVNIEIPDFFQIEHKGFIILESLKEKSKLCNKSSNENVSVETSDNFESNTINLKKDSEKQKLLEKFVIDKDLKIENENTNENNSNKETKEENDKK